jgi:hypothetical protein
MASMLQTEKNQLTGDLTALDKQITYNDTPFILDMPSIWMFLSKVGGGKSSLILNLLEKKSSPYHKLYDQIFLISTTARSDKKFTKLLEELDRDGKFYEKPDNDSLDDILAKSNSYLNLWLEKGNKKEDYKMLLIMDDCIHAVKKRELERLDELITTVRHKQVSLWISSQKFNYIPTLLRNNLSQICIWRTENQLEKKSIIEEIGSDKEKFEKCLEFSTSIPYGFMYCKLHPIIQYYRGFDKILI